MHEYVFPNEAEFTNHQSSEDCWTPHPLVEEIKVVVIVSCSFYMPFPLLERVHLQTKSAKPAWKTHGRGVGRINDLLRRTVPNGGQIARSVTLPLG